MRNKFLLFALLGFVSLSLGANVFVTAAGQTTSFSMNPASVTILSGKSQAITLQINPTGEAVNVVTADIIYDANRLELTSIDYANSAYETKAEETRGNGTLRITRGSSAPKAGLQTIAKLTFKARTSAGTAPINYTDASAAYSPNADGASVSNTAGQKSGAVLTVQTDSGSTTISQPEQSPSTSVPQPTPASNSTTNSATPSVTGNQPTAPKAEPNRPAIAVADPAAAIAATATTDDASRITESPLESTIAKQQEAAHAANVSSKPMTPGTIILFIAAGFAFVGAFFKFVPAIIQRSYRMPYAMAPVSLATNGIDSISVTGQQPTDLSLIDKINGPTVPPPSTIIRPGKDL